MALLTLRSFFCSGGGYAFRLSPAKNLTEAAFQAGHLDFVGETQWLQMGTNRSSRSIAGPIKATRVSGSHTFPAGTEWTRNPIPACKSPGFGNLTVDAAPMRRSDCANA